MIEDREIELIRTASHGDPFSVLGVHADERGWLWLRAFLPGADTVDLLNEAGAVLAELIDPLSGAVTPIRCQSGGVFFARSALRFVTPGKRLGKVAGTSLKRSGRLLSP